MRKEKDWSNTLCLDFDGVICEFETERQGMPIEGAIDGMLNLIDAGWYIEIFSGRCATVNGRQGIQGWIKTHLPSQLYKHFISGYLIIAEHKPVAKLYIDDRGWHFANWSELTPQACKQFRAWWQHPASVD